ncbi:MAG: pyrimidine dimer DNA glycosylase/endonuclease V [Capnocytophaga sp.]|nr:pyrimidine dimer DNA glycosylase/endonuclease V [Capnocytophaga sp.]
MRIWSLHPQLLDVKGLVALWRETLLAKKVLEGNTKGYTNHPQLLRFKNTANPLLAINYYLSEVLSEATSRGYNFDKTKITQPILPTILQVTTKQLSYEWEHLLKKIKQRDAKFYEKVKDQAPRPHPIFQLIDGEIEDWEKI